MFQSLTGRLKTERDGHVAVVEFGFNPSQVG